MSDETKKPGAEHLSAHRFQPGRSGNPGGRARGIEKLGQEFLRGKSYTDAAGVEHKGAAALYQFLWEIAASGKAKDRDRIAAVKEFADRAYGKAKQTVAVTGDGDEDRPQDMTPLTDEQLRVLAALDEAGGGRPTEH